VEAVASSSRMTQPATASKRADPASPNSIASRQTNLGDSCPAAPPLSATHREAGRTKSSWLGRRVSSA